MCHPGDDWPPAANRLTGRMKFFYSPIRKVPVGESSPIGKREFAGIVQPRRDLNHSPTEFALWAWFGATDAFPNVHLHL